MTEEWWLMFFTTVGFIGSVAFGLFLAGALLGLLDNQIRALISRRRHKRRFNKPPQAKCYCKDCKYWKVSKDREREGTCSTHSYFPVTADDWFCWDATPRKCKEGGDI